MNENKTMKPAIVEYCGISNEKFTKGKISTKPIFLSTGKVNVTACTFAEMMDWSQILIHSKIS